MTISVSWSLRGLSNLRALFQNSLIPRSGIVFGGLSFVKVGLFFSVHRTRFQKVERVG